MDLIEQNINLSNSSVMMLFLFFNLLSVEVANASSFLCSCRRHIFWISKQILTIYSWVRFIGSGERKP